MDGTGRALSDLPPPVRFALLGALGFGIVGGVVGLIIGLQVYAPTAWAAMFELGLPAACVGGVLGMGVGLLHGGNAPRQL